MAGAMPARLSATSIEALRECPYRFFARVGLGLAEAVELEADPGRRDQGRWLHEVLHAFHEERRIAPFIDAAAERKRLHEIAERVLAEQQLDGDAMLPFHVTFERLAAHYLDWLHTRDAQGWHYVCGEQQRAISPPELGGLQLDGRLDRIDRHRDGSAMVIDYKTGNADALKRKVKEPLEDTQLAFYAALLNDELDDRPPRAVYLALDERKPPQVIEHPDPARSATGLIEGLAADLDALRSGAGAAALGEGGTCEHCEMRGLCRRDHWADAS
jgi:ATP-dependent helicase/nuclease subunit B